MARFLIQNFGCRATQADGAALGAMLNRDGHTEAESPAEADLVILNTCTVTANADSDARGAVRRAHRSNPDARILVTGCYAQRAPEELANIPGVSWVVGNSHKIDIPRIVALQVECHSPQVEHHSPRAEYHGEVILGDIGAQQECLSAPVLDGGHRTRPNLKIQDGCNNRCSFCIIPFVRGRSRSASGDEVVAQVASLAKRYREVVLSGINLGRWGRDPGRPQRRLVHLIARLLDETPVQRLRLSSVEPMDFSDDLMDLMASSPRIAKHVHTPLQSGSDTVLKRMRRRYRARHYAARLERARRLMPDAGIGADVMAGFPGETDAEFEESRQFIESMPFTYLHVFTYSERPGTPASTQAQVPVPVRKHRNQILTELAAAKNLEFRRRFLGRRLSVVTLEQGMPALSDNYLPVDLAWRHHPNQMLDVEIGGVTPKGLRERSPLPVLAP